MLEKFITKRIVEFVLRFANLQYLSQFATKMGLTTDEITEVIAFDKDNIMKELMESPFERKLSLGNKFGGMSRYSNGDWPAFYSAIERETAERESSHHYGRKAAGDTAARRAVHYSVVRCMFSGEIIDLLVKHSDWPELVSEDYTFCHGLGNEAHNISLAGFFSPSARNPGGTTVPVFLAETLSSPVIEATARMTYNTGNTVVEFIELS